MRDKSFIMTLFVANENTWALPLWNKLIPEFLEKHEFRGIFLFPDRLGRHKGFAIPFWYLKTFGFLNVLLMALYAIKTNINSRAMGVLSWKKLAEKYNIELIESDSPNATEVSEWLKNNNIEILWIMVGDVLKPSIIDSVKKAVINKHATLLPKGRGLLPYIWGLTKKVPLGVTFHRVSAKIDEGDILYQEEAPRQFPTLISYYQWVFQNYPRMALKALENLEKGQQKRQEGKGSYYGLPTRKDFMEFQRMGGKLICLKDFQVVKNEW